MTAGLAAPAAFAPSAAPAAVTQQEVQNAIKEGVRYLKNEQRPDGSWGEGPGGDAPTGLTSLVTLALLTAGEPVTEPHIARSLNYLRQFDAAQLNSTYAIGLQTMVFAAADPDRDKLRIAKNANWLEAAQIKQTDRGWAGTWSYHGVKTDRGDNSNSQYALLGLNAAAEVGVPIDPEIWMLSRQYWERTQHNDGSWTYTPDGGLSTASMTCAGIAGLIISGLKQIQGQEVLVGETIRDCGRIGVNPSLQRGLDWLGFHFRVGENFNSGPQWKYYYLYGLERVGRLSGQRFIGGHDWYREGAEEIVHEQDKIRGFWKGANIEGEPLIATSFALLFLAKGRSPVLINKIRHDPRGDWNNDLDDVRNLTASVSRDWKHMLTWQIVDPNFVFVEDLLMAPILFLNGHDAPAFSQKAKQNLREYVEQGGFIFAEACCSKAAFDEGFRSLVHELFPEPEYALKPLPPEHPIWKSRYRLSPDIHELWGVDFGCRTVVVYSPKDLSCFWNQAENQPGNPAVEKALRVGQNVVDYATGRELPADKLTVRTLADFKTQKTAPRGALHIAKLKHAGDWNVAPLAVPNLTTALRDELKIDVVINHHELLPQDPNLIYYPLIYLHGRASFSFGAEDLAVLRKHLEPGGGTLFADSACGSAAFDAAFRKFVAELLPDNPLVAIPADDEIYTAKVGYDLSDVAYSIAAGGGTGKPKLEGVKINGRWAIIYSKLDLGCALERHQSSDCKGYLYESALRIAANIVLYSTLP